MSTGSGVGLRAAGEGPAISTSCQHRGPAGSHHPPAPLNLWTRPSLRRVMRARRSAPGRWEPARTSRRPTRRSRAACTAPCWPCPSCGWHPPSCWARPPAPAAATACASATPSCSSSMGCRSTPRTGAAAAPRPGRRASCGARRTRREPRSRVAMGLRAAVTRPRPRPRSRGAHLGSSPPPPIHVEGRPPLLAPPFMLAPARGVLADARLRACRFTARRRCPGKQERRAARSSMPRTK
jgi:hypothetical protein